MDRLAGRLVDARKSLLALEACMAQLRELIEVTRQAVAEAEGAMAGAGSPGPVAAAAAWE
jgi:hypothetical protein